MKYYLIVGYHLTEKYRDYPTVRISINGKLVTEFICDNEEVTETKLKRTGRTKILATKGVFGDVKEETQEKCWTIPKKCQILELDSAEWGEQCDLILEGIGNRSNYTNGFMTKESLVAFLPVYLIPKPLLDNTELLDRIVTKTFGFSYYRINENKKSRWRWPGIYEAFPQFFGGEFKKKLLIRKKLNFYFIDDPDERDGAEATGFPLVKQFAYAFLSHLQKVRRDIYFNGELQLPVGDFMPKPTYDIKLQKNKYTK